MTIPASGGAPYRDGDDPDTGDEMAWTTEDNRFLAAIVFAGAATACLVASNFGLIPTGLATQVRPVAAAIGVPRVAAPPPAVDVPAVVDVPAAVEPAAPPAQSGSSAPSATDTQEPVMQPGHDEAVVSPPPPAKSEVRNIVGAVGGLLGVDGGLLR
jgi:hypothetical protein